MAKYPIYLLKIDYDLPSNVAGRLTPSDKDSPQIPSLSTDIFMTTSQSVDLSGKVVKDKLAMSNTIKVSGVNEFQQYLIINSFIESIQFYWLIINNSTL